MPTSSTSDVAPALQPNKDVTSPPCCFICTPLPPLATHKPCFASFTGLAVGIASPSHFLPLWLYRGTCFPFPLPTSPHCIIWVSPLLPVMLEVSVPGGSVGFQTLSCKEMLHQLVQDAILTRLITQPYALSSTLWNTFRWQMLLSTAPSAVADLTQILQLGFNIYIQIDIKVIYKLYTSHSTCMYEVFTYTWSYSGVQLHYTLSITHNGFRLFLPLLGHENPFYKARSFAGVASMGRLKL